MNLLAPLTHIDAGGAVLTLRRAWPRRPDHVLLEYLAGGRRVAGQWFGDDRGRPDTARLDRVARRTAERATKPHDVILLPELGVLLQRNGADRVLVPLADLAARRGATLLRHRPERRGVVHIAGPPERYLKVVRPDRVRQVVRGAAAAEAVRGLRSARLVAADVETAGVTQWLTVPGRSLHERLADADVVTAAGAVGHALAAFHRTAPLPNAPVHSAADEEEVVRGWARLRQALAGRAIAERYLDDVSRRLAGSPTRPVLVHRDLHDKQILLDDAGSVGLIDLDTLAVGEAAVDLANLLVHLELRALQGRCTQQAAEAFGAALLDGYRPDRVTLDRIGPYADAARLRLTCVYAFRPNQCTRVEALLERFAQPPTGRSLSRVVN